MKKNMAKTLFCEGVLGKASATVDLSGGYNLAFGRKKNMDEMEYLKTERGEIRRFKTADAALSMAQDIGFKKIEFVL